MADRDFEAVVARIRRAIEESPYHSRRIRCYRLLSEFGIQKRSELRIRRIEDLFRQYSVAVYPELMTAPLHDWLHLGLVEDRPTAPDRPADPKPPPGWFDSMAHLRLTTEREVESRFVSPLFHALGFTDDQETIGLPVTLWEGVHPRHAEVDLAYFADADRAEESRVALVIVECKAPGHDLEGALGQARSYCDWVKPVAYVVTNGDLLRAYLHQPGPLPDPAVSIASRQELEATFDELYRYLSLEATLELRERAEHIAQSHMGHGAGPLDAGGGK